MIVTWRGVAIPHRLAFEAQFIICLLYMRIPATQFCYPNRYPRRTECQNQTGTIGPNCLIKNGASDRDRTGDIQIHNLAL